MPPGPPGPPCRGLPRHCSCQPCRLGHLDRWELMPPSPHLRHITRSHHRTAGHSRSAHATGLHSAPHPHHSCRRDPASRPGLAHRAPRKHPVRPALTSHLPGALAPADGPVAIASISAVLDFPGSLLRQPESPRVFLVPESCWAARSRPRESLRRWGPVPPEQPWVPRPRRGRGPRLLRHQQRAARAQFLSVAACPSLLASGTSLPPQPVTKRHAPAIPRRANQDVQGFMVRAFLSNQSDEGPSDIDIKDRAPARANALIPRSYR